MNFRFYLGDTPLEPQEAVALLEATSTSGSKAPVINLDKFIDTTTLDAGRLFEMAVSSKNQNLAALAWKISVQQPATTKAAVQKFIAPNLKVVSQASKKKSLDEIIEHLNSTQSYCALGVAMLLKATSNSEWITLRETATYFANEVIAPSGSFASKFLRGFELIDRKLVPVDLSSGVERKRTFHVSPMYIALREGLVFCKENDLVENKRMLSVGALYAKDPAPSADATRRIYYKITATERGKALTEMWADLDRYIEKNLQVQAAS